MSHFLYGHKDLTGEQDVWKVGRALTPYSAIRLRQRLCWKTIGLDYLFFGRPRDIEFLESKVKTHFKYSSGTALAGKCRTELFKVAEKELFAYIRRLIKDHELHVQEIKLETPYVAASAGDCPFKIPQEYDAGSWCDALVEQKWGKDPRQLRFESLFSC